jgi:hypothetical protein
MCSPEVTALFAKPGLRRGTRDVLSPVPAVWIPNTATESGVAPVWEESVVLGEISASLSAWVEAQPSLRAGTSGREPLDRQCKSS